MYSLVLYFTTIIEALHCNPPPVLYTSVTLIVGQLLFVCKQMTPKDLKNKKRPFLNLYELFKYKLHSIPSMLNVFQPFYLSIVLACRQLPLYKTNLHVYNDQIC